MNPIHCLLLATLWGCSPRPSAIAAPPALPEVKVWGALRAMMHEGRIDSEVELATILPGPHFYGIGALAGMRGEVTVLDGVAWVADGQRDQGKATAGTSGEGATLLVGSVVKAWRRITLTDDIPFAELDQRIEALAKGAGIDVGQRFAFLIEGQLAGVRWHVLKGPPPRGALEHGHAQNAFVGERATLDGTLIGFFSRRDQGVFTHMGQNTHVHVLCPAEAIAAHADEVSIRAGSVLRLPAL
jgi:alpha-acetolactate decarboxylase